MTDDSDDWYILISYFNDFLVNTPFGFFPWMNSAIVSVIKFINAALFLF
jgi:hypothetical protein